jgi:hypothetical protein
VTENGEAPRKWLRVKETVHWSAAVAEAVLARTAAGESLRGMARTPGMPTVQSVCRWARERAGFRAALDAARAAAGRPFGGPVLQYCEETAAVVFDRVCAGEGLSRICADPDMPALSTVRRWMKLKPEFDAAIDLARDITADRTLDQGDDLCEAATPETAYLTRVRLGQLRWKAAKLAPRKYGTLKSVEPAAGAEGGAGGPVTNVWLKTYVYDPDGGPPRESDRPPELIHSVQAPAARGGEPLVTLGPASGPAREAVMADRRRAGGEAAEAALAAGVRFNGLVPARFWPAWFREAHPQDFAEHAAALRHAARARIAAMAGHGLAPEAEDLIAAEWTAEEAAERWPVRGSEGAGERGSS